MLEVGKFYRHKSENCPFVLKVNGIGEKESEAFVKLNVTLIPIMREEWKEIVVIEMAIKDFANWYEVSYREMI